MRHSRLLCFCLSSMLLLPLWAAAQAPSDSMKEVYALRAKAHAEKLLSLQKKSSHLWRRAGWWNCANILESLIDYHQLSGKDFSAELKKIYRRNLYGWRFRYIDPTATDDDEWWALAWLKAYKATGEKKYLHISQNIFRHSLRTSWDTMCGGGLHWQRYNHYKNSVTNELFFTLGARLALEAKDTAEKNYYLNWALKDWQWFRQSKMYTDSFWISDGLNRDCSCVHNPGLDLTYTQGIVLGGLTWLYRLTGDRTYLDEAKKLANESMKHFSNANGILTDAGGPNNDKIQFKGIYIRYLALLNTELRDPAITTFILHNADHAWQHSRNTDGLSDYDWNGPYKDWSGAAQGSTMDLMNAAMMQR